MAGGVASQIVEKLITQVTLEGTELVSNQQRMLAAGFRGISGDVHGMREQLAGLKLSTRDYLIAGGAMVGAGAGMLAYMRKAAAAAAQQEEAENRLAVAFGATGRGTSENAQNISRYAGELQRLTGAGDEEIVNLGAILAQFKMNEEQVKAFIPRILDLQQGMQKLGKEALSLEQLGTMVGKTFADPQLVTSLRRFGIIIDTNEVATRGYIAVLEGLDKSFGGQAAGRMNTYAGQLNALGNAVSDIHEAVGSSVLALAPMIGLISKATLAFAGFHEKTHGVAGILIAAAGGLLVVAGGITMIQPGIIALRNFWLQVAGAANTATAAQVRASTASAGAAATAGRLGAGRLGRGIGGVGAIAGMLGGGYLYDWGVKQADAAAAANAADRSKIAAKAAAGTVGGGALTGAGVGATIGSIVPALGTAVGAILGAGVGAIWGGIAGTKHGGGAAAAVESGKQAVAVPQAETNGWLSQIAGLLKDQNRVIVGGGSRAQKALNEGDVQRAMFVMLSKQVI